MRAIPPNKPLVSAMPASVFRTGIALDRLPRCWPSGSSIVICALAILRAGLLLRGARAAEEPNVLAAN